MNKIQFLLATLLVLSVSCKTTKISDPNTYSGKQLILGAGGGATGKTTTYYLLDNGQVFIQESAMGEVKEYNKLKKDKTKAVFELVGSLEMEKENINKPGNMTWFITLKQAGANSSTVKWGDSGYVVPDKFSSAFKKIQSIIHQ